MPLERHLPEIDRLYPRPEAGESWNPHLIHTNYFGFTVPEAELGAFVYLRCHPTFGMCHGGVAFFRGMDNVDPLDAEHFDYEISMPWPEITSTSVTTENGLRIEWLEPGRAIRLTYTSNDGQTRMDVVATAVTPLVARGHVMPGEELHRGGSHEPTGAEQIMRYEGELVVNGTRYAVDAHDVRDRSLNQVRSERQDAVLAPPLSWTPMKFGDDIAMNCVGPETHDTDPLWPAAYDIPPEKVRPVFGWNYSAAADEALQIVRTRRNVLERHAGTGMPIRQELETEDERGTLHHFSGHALAVASMPMWPNVNMRLSVYRWEDEHARMCHSLTQELWFDRFQRALKRTR